MNRTAYALLQVAQGRGSTRQFPIHKIQSFQVDTAIDNDADSFSIELGDPHAEWVYLTDRDVETKVSIFINNEKGKTVPIFTGIADDVAFSTNDYAVVLTGRDMSALAVDSDAPPGRWRHVKPKPFLTQRAHALGLTTVAIASMREIGTLYTDASETEWQFWYRIARMRDMFMWTGPLGALYVNQLAYGSNPSYFFGTPPQGQPAALWQLPESIAVRSSKQQRKRQVWVYGEDQKAGLPFYARAVDTTIPNWKRHRLSIITSSTAKSNADAKKDANEEVFESIVGAWSVELVIPDRGQTIKQNTMCRLHMPEPLNELNGLYFIVGVTRQGGPDGFTQTVRLRERGFAVTERKPDAPTLTKTNDPAAKKIPASIAATLALASTQDGRPLPWTDYFVQATREFGVPAGWDFSVFLGVLLSICEHESNFRNVRGGGDYAWQSYDDFSNDPRQSDMTRDVAIQYKYAQTFANAQNNSLNPRYPSSECAVGPMQLVTPAYKVWADDYGWLGVAKRDELAGGRWNPFSNIRAGARALVEKLKAPPAANPNDPATIWAGVARYYGSSSAADNQAYMTAIKKRYDARWQAIAATATAAAHTLPAGTQTKITYNGETVGDVPDNTPDVVRKAINFCEKRLGDFYKYGGAGPRYDCSSLVTAAYANASSDLRDELDEPVAATGHHGETTYTLFRKGRFKDVKKDALLPGDLVFFDTDGEAPGHVGIFIGDGKFIDDPHSGAKVRVSHLGDDYWRDHFYGARRLVDWPAPSDGKDEGGSSGGAGRVVMIQAGHTIPAGTIPYDEPYGHEGQTGAAGEQAFTASVRDKAVARFDADPRFSGVGGTAWNASGGASSAPGDNIPFNGDIFVSVHYDRGTSGSGFFFGYTRGAVDGRSDAVSAASAKLADAIAERIGLIPGGPARLLPDNNNFGGTPANATGWGYYAWGSTQRASPDDINHCPNVEAAVIVECGRSLDGYYLDHNQNDIAGAIYEGICDYYKLKPVG